MPTNWVQASFRLPRGWIKAIRRYGVEHDVSNQQIIHEALREWADKHGVKLDENDNASADDGEPQAAA